MRATMAWSGLKMYFALDRAQLAALRGHVELVLFAGGYAGLQLVEADRAVLCALVPRAQLRPRAGRWGSLLHSLTAELPHLAMRLSGARALLPTAAGDCQSAVWLRAHAAGLTIRPGCSDWVIRRQ